MNIPKDLLYSETHEWVQFLSDTTARVGVTDHAQQALGDLVFVTLPNVSDAMEKGGHLADVESVKAVTEVYCPVTGTVSAVNEALLDAPGQLNADPYGAWLAEISGIIDREGLLDAAAYEALCAAEA